MTVALIKTAIKTRTRIPGRGGVQEEQIILQRKGGETNGILYRNTDPRNVAETAFHLGTVFFAVGFSVMVTLDVALG